VPTNITFQFNRKKAIETILYLSPRITDSDIYGICKLLYLADKTHLEKYGRFIFGETYCAMKNGATPSNVYDLLKESSEEPSTDLEIKGHQVIALRDANSDYLSETDIECLDQVISVWGKVPNWQRKDAAHDNAWEKAWKKRGDKGSFPIPVESIAELFDDSDDLIAYLSNS
jgi:uncharacterized phage-associated protein